MEPRRRPKDRRDQILRAAAALFTTQGFPATTMADIARAVDITGGALYRHFASKDELLQVIALETVADYRRALPPPSDDPRQRMVDHLRNSVILSLSEPTRVCTYIRETHHLPDERRREVRKEQLAVRDAWTELLSSVEPAWQLRDIQVREAAVSAVMSVLAERRHALPKDRLVELMTAGLVGLMDTPPLAAQAAEDAPPGWTAPLSRHQAILRAAATLFREQGFDGVGIDEIGRASGIAGPTVYRTYASKADILVDAYDRALASVIVSTDAALAEATSADDALERVALAHAKVAMRETDFIVVHGREQRSLPAEYREKARRRTQDHRHLWARVLQDVRPDLDEAECRALTAPVFSVLRAFAVLETGIRPSAAEAAGMALAFMRTPAQAAVK